MKMREITLTLKVKAPATVGESTIENAINEALNEPPCDWGEWEVGAATITDVQIVAHGARYY